MYSTIEEVKAMIKEDAINEIIGEGYIEDESEKKEKIEFLINQAIEDADGEIDGYINKRYPTPLSSTPKIINKLSKDIAIYNLFSRSGIDEGERESNYLTRYKAAIKFLENVAKGIVELGISGSTNSQTSDKGFSMSSNNRLFSRQSMRGM